MSCVKGVKLEATSTDVNPDRIFMVRLPPRPALTRAVRMARSAWERDSALPVATRWRKARHYLVGSIAARVYLRNTDGAGAGVRCTGRPLITNDGYLHIGEGSVLRSLVLPVELSSGPLARLEIGRGAVINNGASIAATESIVIGARALIGPYVMINDTAYHDLHERSVMPPPQPIVIEDDVWLGAKSTVLPGVHIGRGAVVSAHALVTKNVEEFTIVSGVPAVAVAKLNPKKFKVAEIWQEGPAS